jgi:hypothetical protein
MPLLRFTLSEEGVTALHDALACLNKFSDEVSLEAKRDQVRPLSYGFLNTFIERAVQILTSIYFLAGLYSFELLQVCVCLFLTGNKSFLLSISLRGSISESRQVLLQVVQQGGLSTLYDWRSRNFPSDKYLGPPAPVSISQFWRPPA